MKTAASFYESARHREALRKVDGFKKVGGGLKLYKKGFTGSLLLDIWHFLQKAP